MKRVMTHVLTTVALIATLGLTAYANHGHFGRHDGNDATNATATQPAAGHPDLYKEGHPDRYKGGHPN